MDEERRKNEAFEASQSRTQQQKLREEKLKESEKQEDEDWKNSWVKHGLMWLMDVIYIYNIYIHYIRVRGTACVWSKKCTLFGCNSYMRDPWVLEGMVPQVLTLALNPHFSRRIFQYKVWKLATGRVLSLFWSNDSMKCACVLHRGLHGCRV